jgi:hypothetical protein
MGAKTEQKSIAGKLFFPSIFLGVILLFATNYLVFMFYLKPEDRGVNGDMFGAVNALFSGLAFAGLIVAILLQKDELTLQREELKFTRDEFRGQKEQMELQNETLRKQNFENTFFALLKLQNDLVSSIDISSGGDVLVGRDCFSSFYRSFRNNFSRADTNHSLTELLKIHEAYRSTYNNRQGDLGHYFRNLYNLVKFVHTAEVSNKKFYANLVRAQLSNQELQMLFYNCLSPNGSEKFKPLIEEYALLKNLPEDLLCNPTHKTLYSASAFGGN